MLSTALRSLTAAMVPSLLVFILAAVNVFAIDYPVLDFPPGVLTWCGKAYMATNASLGPIGILSEPARSPGPRLLLQAVPRMNLYVEGETTASFIVSTTVEFFEGVGEPLEATSSGSSDTLSIDIVESSTGRQILSGNVPINSTDNEFQFSLAEFPASFTPYDVTVTGRTLSGQSFHASSAFIHLPKRTDGGTIARLDSKFGALYALDSESNSWTAIIPYSFYVSGSFIFDGLSNVDVYKALGFNMIHIVPNGDQSEPFGDWDTFDQYLDKFDEVGLWLMYDMRNTYKNLSSVEAQVQRLTSRKSLLLWYTGDEPDGAGDPTNATKIAYDTIKAIDPWHPISLVLNCDNFFFEQYTSGTDIILEDTYPIGINATFSTQFFTVCNETYGDCGCDDCNGSFEDISTRLDNFVKYQNWLGLPQKTLWGVPQGFGEETYWPRFPTIGEEVVMNMLSINHNAKGIVIWDLPSGDDDLPSIAGNLSKVITSPAVAPFLANSSPTMQLKVTGRDRVDVSSWTLSTQSQMLLSIVALGYEDTSSLVTVMLPEQARSVKSVLWGESGWQIADGGRTATKLGMGSLEVDLLVLDLF